MTEPLGISSYSIKRSKRGSPASVEYLNENPPEGSKYVPFSFSFTFLYLFVNYELVRACIYVSSLHTFFELFFFPFFFLLFFRSFKYSALSTRFIICLFYSPAFSVKRGKSEDIVVRNSYLQATFDPAIGLLRVSCSKSSAFCCLLISFYFDIFYDDNSYICTFCIFVSLSLHSKANLNSVGFAREIRKQRG